MKEIENDADHEAQHTSPLKEGTTIEIRNTEAREIGLKTEEVIDRLEKAPLKLVGKPKALYHHKPRLSRRIRTPHPL